MCAWTQSCILYLVCLVVYLFSALLCRTDKIFTKESLFLLSERFSQDPLENYFGKQWSRGGRNENPTVKRCLVNAAALRVQGSTAIDPVRGNCRRKRWMDIDQSTVIDSAPLPKRKRSAKPSI